MEGIGLAELIEKVKADLLLTPENDTRPFLFVDSVELELQVVVKKDADTGIEVDVIGIGGASLGADVGQENIQTIKVNLSPLLTKEEIREYYKTLRPNDVLPMINESIQAVLKGTEEDQSDPGL